MYSGTLINDLFALVERLNAERINAERASAEKRASAESERARSHARGADQSAPGGRAVTAETVPAAAWFEPG